MAIASLRRGHRPPLGLHPLDRPDPHPAPLLQGADLDVPASGKLDLIEGARLVGDGLRWVALLHGAFLDRPLWQRARHARFIERLENGFFSFQPKVVDLKGSSRVFRRSLQPERQGPG